MPNATIYIRKENWDTWESLADKSLQVNHWLTVARNGETTKVYDEVSTVDRRELEKFKIPKSPNIRMESTPVKKATPIVKAKPLSKTCKAGHTALDTGFCLTKGCKYNTTNRGKK